MENFHNDKIAVLGKYKRTIFSLTTIIKNLEKTHQEYQITIFCKNSNNTFTSCNSLFIDDIKDYIKDYIKKTKLKIEELKKELNSIFTMQEDVFYNKYNSNDLTLKTYN